MVQICKMIISPGVFFNTKNFDFPGCQGAERAKNGPKCRKFCLSHIISQEPYMIFIYGTHVCIKE